jgi:hypothetical protein
VSVEAAGTPPTGHGISFAEATRTWAWVGLNSFGGPAGQIAVMHRKLVEEKKWIGEDRFLHALNYCMLLPGPEAQQLAVYVGWLLHADEALRGEVIAAAARSRSLQRDLDHALNEHVLDQLFADDLRADRVRTATVMGFSRDKVHLTLDDPPIDVKWYFAHIEAAIGVRPRVSDDGVSLVAAGKTVARLGDAVTVRVTGFDDAKRRWALDVR